jgi:8-oxo-dGTP pyrophosphatase MutT (NUDIX family)
MTVRVVCRGIILDQDSAKLLLVRNKGSDFWYPPGGGWDHADETIEQCIIRETLEETTIHIQPIRLLYVQEFHPSKEVSHLELFWFCTPISSTKIGNIKDLHGITEEARWFSKEDIQTITVFPERLKSKFWIELSSTLGSPNPLIR